MIAEKILAALSSKRIDEQIFGGEGDTENPLGLLLEEYPDLPQMICGKSVLDFGCGHGHQTAALTPMCAKAVGLDTNAKVLASARAKHPSLIFVESVGQERFDIVISQNAMEHYQDPAATLSIMLGLLNHGGKLLITFGPPWYSPRGSHMHWFCKVPWLNLWFSEKTIMAVRSRYVNDGAQHYMESKGGLNQMSIAKLERLLAGTNVSLRKYRCVKGLDFLGKIPLLRELFINRATLVVERQSS